MVERDCKNLEVLNKTIDKNSINRCVLENDIQLKEKVYLNRFIRMYFLTFKNISFNTPLHSHLRYRNPCIIDCAYNRRLLLCPATMSCISFSSFGSLHSFWIAYRSSWVNYNLKNCLNIVYSTKYATECQQHYHCRRRRCRSWHRHYRHCHYRHSIACKWQIICALPVMAAMATTTTFSTFKGQFISVRLVNVQLLWKCFFLKNDFKALKPTSLSNKKV